MLASLQVRETQAGTSPDSDPEPVRVAEEKGVSIAGGQRDHRRAVVEPAAQVLPLPVAQLLRGLLELALGVGHVVRRQGRDRGGDAGAIRLELRLARLVVRHVGVVLGLGTLAGCVALAAFVSGGSMSAPRLPEVPPPPTLSATVLSRALFAAAAVMAPTPRAQQHHDFFDLGLQVAHGRLHWTDATLLTAQIL